MKTLAVFSLLAACAFACGGEARQGPDPQLSAGSATAPGWPDLGRGEARFIRIDLGPDVFAECQRVSPKFPFDSANTYAQDRQQLEALATCLNAPGQRERSIVLVGRADPKGTEGYNDQLGMKRAEAIKKLLIDNGIKEERIQLSSEGKRGAQGDTPETSAGRDRRVDIVIRGGTHLP